MMKSRMIVRAGLLLALAAGSVALAPLVGIGAQPARAETPDEVIVARKAGYKHMGETFEAMKKAIADDSDVKPLAPKAQELVDWGHKIPTLFPVGSETGHDTHALPTIWSDREGFDKAAANFTAAATKLTQVAETGDKAAFADQWKATGGTCGACHRTYRAKLN